jgi:hypothetical protein
MEDVAQYYDFLAAFVIKVFWDVTPWRQATNYQ